MQELFQRMSLLLTFVITKIHVLYSEKYSLQVENFKEADFVQKHSVAVALISDPEHIQTTDDCGDKSVCRQINIYAIYMILQLN